MLSPLAQKFRDDIAPRLMAKMGNGGVGVVVRVLSPAPDPLMPPTATQTVREFKSWAKGVTAQMVATDPNLQATDLRVLVAALDYAPKVGDVVQVSGVDRRVIRVDAIPSADDAAIFWFYIR